MINTIISLPSSVAAKVVRVINSCTTPEQLQTARRFADLYLMSQSPASSAKVRLIMQSIESIYEHKRYQLGAGR